MLDLNNEPLIPFVEAAKQLPRRRAGRATHASTIHRWRIRGLRGVRLEAVRIGGIWHTSIAALHRFFKRRSLVESEPEVEGQSTGSSTMDRDKQTEDELDALGLG